MDEPKSKSQKKREADALQALGIKLTALSEDKLESLSLTDPLKKAILDAKKLKSHGAIRRQAQLIGKLMRSADHEVILSCYNQMLAAASATTAEFHEAEHWRTRLIDEGKEALTEFISKHPEADIQHLRQLIKKALDEQSKQQHTGAGKALFRYIRACQS